MKKTITNFALAALTLVGGRLSAQCISASQYGGTTVTSNTAGASFTMSTCNYAGEYAPTTFNVTGPFTFSTSAGDYITVTDNSNTNVVASGMSPLAATIPSVGVYNVHFATSGPPGCGTQSTCRTTWVFVPLSNCSGMPSAGTVPSSYSICPNTATQITATGATAASGIVYQWMQSPNGTSGWTNVTGGSGGNTPAYTTASLTTLTYYQLVVTCNISAQSATSAVVGINPNLPISMCYCNTNLGGSGCSGDNITNVQILSTTLNNTSTCNSTPQNGTYTQFLPGSGTTATLVAGATYSISVNTTANNIESVWIDFDQSGTFDVGEHTQICLTSTAGVPTVVSFSVPVTALTGQTGMRVRSRATGNQNGPPDACLSFGSGECEDYFVTIQAAVACSGTPNAGTTTASSTLVCMGSTVNMSLNGSTIASGLTYQWESSPNGTTWSAIPTATSISTSQVINSVMYYHCIVSCSANSATSTPIQINVVGAPVYAATPFLETFDNTWQNRCDNHNVPVLNNWSSNPSTGNQSWRRQDDGTTANWTAPGTGTVMPMGVGCANFHSYYAPNASTGDLDLYVNLSGANTYSMSFYYFNNSGSDSLEVFLSNNGGSTFNKVGGYTTASAWAYQTINLGVVNSNSCVVRFTGTSDFGNDDIAIDSLKLFAVSPCSGTPNAGTTTATSTLVCSGNTVNITIAGSTAATGITYQWESSPNGTTWTSIPTATSIATNQTITASMYYRCIVSCSSNTAASVPVQINMVGAPAYAAVPFLETFDNTWQNRCDNHNVPVLNNWASNPTTGNNSWRRQDDGSTANWTAPATGIVAPIGVGCANFHSYYASSGSTGDLDLYVNLSGTTTYSMSFYYYNQTGSDSMEVFLSNNGGASFNKIGGYTTTSTSWIMQNITLGAINSNSCVVRFTATSDFGNDDIAIDSLKIFSNCTPPTLSTSSTNSVICAGQSATLTASGATTYTWSTGSNSTSIVVTPTASTTYTVTGDNAGCPATTTILQMVSTCAGIDNIVGNASDVMVYPNPTNGVLNVSVPEVKSNMTLEIYDAIGKLVMSTSLTDKQTAVKTEQLAYGIYIYRIKTNSEVVKQGKLVKE